MSCPSSCGESCPSPTSLNVYQTIVTMDSAVYSPIDEYFAHSQLDDPSWHDLAYYPFSESCVKVVKNGLILSRGATADFTVNGQRVTLNAPSIDGDKWAFFYDTAEGQTASSIGVGSIVGFDGAVADAGWLLMDGVTAHLKTTYAALWTYLSTHTDLLETSDTTTFTLKNMSFTVYQGGEYHSMGAAIKT